MQQRGNMNVKFKIILLTKIDFFTPKKFTTIKCVFPNLPIAKPVHDSAWLAVTY
jgi:hypothetical protein